MEDSRIREIIDELDASVPRESSKVQIFQYGGGPDESAIRGDREGLLSFARSIMLSAIEESNTDNLVDNNKTGLDNSISEQSDIFLHYVQREPLDENVDEYSALGIKQRIFEFGLYLLLVSIPVFWLVGVGSFIYWLVS